jgi:hypothetical protein
MAVSQTKAFADPYKQDPHQNTHALKSLNDSLLLSVCLCRAQEPVSKYRRLPIRRHGSSTLVTRTGPMQHRFTSQDTALFARRRPIGTATASFPAHAGIFSATADRTTDRSMAMRRNDDKRDGFVAFANRISRDFRTTEVVTP